MIGIIPAAGKGTRLKELGRNYSKTILPYQEKPLIIHQIEWLESQGCIDIRVVLNHLEEGVRDILEMYNKTPMVYIQTKLNGLSGAIDIAMSNEQDSPVLICLGDIIPKRNITDLTVNLVSVQHVEDFSRWCMVSNCYSPQPLVFIDKPTERPDTEMALSGVYYLRNYNKVKSLLQLQLNSSRNYQCEDEYQFSWVLSEIVKDEYIAADDLRVVDFGTLSEYLENKDVKKSRSFNNVEVSGDYTITKSSAQNREKIRAEVNWFKDLPHQLKPFTPRIYDSYFYGDTYSYTMDKILAPSLRDIYLFLDSSYDIWSTIFDNLFHNVLESFAEYDSDNDFMEKVIDKTILRANQLQQHLNLTHSEKRTVKDFLENKLPALTNVNQGCLMHGDFCFSNILYDLNSNRVSLIDPRGELLGDHFYDIAKLYHSVICDYDFVDAELYTQTSKGYQLYNKGKEKVKLAFMDKLITIYNVEQIKHIELIVASLFLSMIPLHTHNKNNQKIYFEIFLKMEKDL